MAETKLEAWETRLRIMLDAVDHALEECFGEHFALRPDRPARGSTANPKYDGLFAVDGRFSLGLVSQTAPGYVIKVRLATFDSLPDDTYEAILQEAEATLRGTLFTAFPGREMVLVRDGHVFRLHGDLSLS